jgi:eukaryotic-like serine/threonine-protein kinase
MTTSRLLSRRLYRPVTPEGTVTMLFSDIEDSTLINGRLGDQRWLDVLRSHNTIVRRIVRRHAGYEVKAQGDGFMVAFASARRAIQCAVAVQRAFSAYRHAHCPEPLRVRIGLHTGEAIREDNDFYGRNVIVAARIADQARGGEILVSALVKELVESASDIRFQEDREVELKGLLDTRRVYRVVWSANPEQGSRPAARPPLSQESRDEYVRLLKASVRTPLGWMLR